MAGRGEQEKWSGVVEVGAGRGWGRHVREVVIVGAEGLGRAGEQGPNVGRGWCGAERGRGLGGLGLEVRAESDCSGLLVRMGWGEGGKGDGTSD